MGMINLPFRPKTVHIGMMGPEDWIEGGRQIAIHVPILRLGIHLRASVIIAPGNDHSFPILVPFRILPSRPNVDGVVRVLIHEAIGVVVFASSSIIAVVAEALDLGNVVG